MDDETLILHETPQIFADLGDLASFLPKWQNRFDLAEAAARPVRPGWPMVSGWQGNARPEIK